MTSTKATPGEIQRIRDLCEAEYLSRKEEDGLLGWREHAYRSILKFFWTGKRPVDSVLDIGTGRGAVLGCLKRDLRPVPTKCVGFDISPTQVDRCRERWAKDGLEFVCADFETFPAKKRFDLVVLFSILLHVERTRVEELVKRTKKWSTKWIAVVHPASPPWGDQPEHREWYHDDKALYSDWKLVFEEGVNGGPPSLLVRIYQSPEFREPEPDAEKPAP